MTDEDLKAELTRLEPFEGRVPWPYLDARGLVTTGVGYLLHDVDAMLAMPWHHLDDGLPATPDEVRAEYFRVQAMPAGLGANHYKGALRLLPADIDAEGVRRLRVFLAGLPGVFPGYDGFPRPAQLALLDLAWNDGLGAPATATHAATGLRGWTHLLAACNAVPPNWANRIDDGTPAGACDPMCAAAQCRTANPNNNPDRQKRNDWRSQSFIDAAVAPVP